MPPKNRYEQLIEAIFLKHYRPGLTEFSFQREEIETSAAGLGVVLPKNLGDLIYSFRYRSKLPEAIRRAAPEGMRWLILPAGRGRYKFSLTHVPEIAPNEMLAEIKIPDATPGVIARYALSDEQALLAIVRYNRMIDIFTRAACYSLQSHLRSAVPGIGQVETDEIYVGIARDGAHYAFPVQAKGGKDKLSDVQIQQDIALCQYRFPALAVRPIGAQFLQDGAIALFEFTQMEGAIRILTEKHYRLVAPENLTTEDLEKYRISSMDD